MDLSIIIPIYNEKDNLVELHRRLTDVLADTNYSYELVFVEDGSNDGSLLVLLSMAKVDPSVRIVQLSRNYGQHPAIAAGFSVAKGNVLVTIDADLQIDPEFILPLVEKIHAGHDFVSGVRKGIGDSLLRRRLPSYILNKIICVAIGKRLRDYACPLNAMMAKIALAMAEYGDMQRFYKPLAVKLATDITEVEIKHGSRRAGHSKYQPLKLIDLVFDFVTNFSRQLFQRVAMAGLGLGGVSFAAGIFYLISRFFTGLLPEPSNRVQFIIFMGLMFGMQLVILGVLGDFVIRIYRKTESKPLYTIKEIF